MLTSKGALALFLFLNLFNFAYFRSTKWTFTITALYLSTLVYISSFRVTSGYTHYNALKSALFDLPANLTGSFDGYMFFYDTFLALVLHNFGLIGLIYYYATYLAIEHKKCADNHKIYFYIIGLMVNSVMHVEPMTVSAAFPALLLYFSIHKATVDRK